MKTDGSALGAICVALHFGDLLFQCCFRESFIWLSDLYMSHSWGIRAQAIACQKHNHMNHAIRLFTFVIFAFGGLSTAVAQECEQQTLVFSITTDGYPEETTWNIVDNDGNIVLSGGPYEESNTLYTSEACVPLGCYTLQLMDSYGDGFDGNFDSGIGVYTISMNGVVLQQVFPIFYDMGTYSFCEQEGEGCTDPYACNYDVTVANDDGSCVFVSNPVVDMTSTEWSSVLRYPLTGIYVEGGVISFSGDGVVLADGGFYAGSWYLCDNVLTTVSSGIFGSVDVYEWNGELFTLVEGGSSFFDDLAVTLEPAITGCPVPFACNYDPNANIVSEENPCDYESCAFCSDPTACNYRPDGSDDWALCDYGECDEACQDYDACNFSLWAYVNDLGTYEDCIYPGCMDLLALNYDAEAGCEISYSGEQFCEYADWVVPGCTNSFASNYDPNATVDNGSCDMSFLCGPGTFFDEASGSCLVIEGGAPSCPSDLDGNGTVGNSDLLDFLSDFGATCD